MMASGLAVRDIRAEYRRLEVFHGVSFQLAEGQALGVLGPNGAGKTTLLRMLVGLITPRTGEIRVRGLTPRDALSRLGIAYFGGDATLPGAARASGWSQFGAVEHMEQERRRLRTLSRGTRQLLGLKAALLRHPLGLIVLDEPWECLDADAAQWLSVVLRGKRDRGAMVVVSSHRLQGMAGLCDTYLFLLNQHATVVKAHDITRMGPVTAALLSDMFETLARGRSS